MSSTTHISEEDMKYNSVITTHTALIELGRLDEVQKNNEKQQEIDNNEIIKFLEKYKTILTYFESENNPDKNNNVIFENPELLKEIINKSLEHIYKFNELINDNKTKYTKLQDENTDLLEDYKELILQIDELEKYIENKTNLSNERIEKLRNICIKKNKTIYILKKLLIIIIIHLCVISYFGFLKYYYILISICIGWCRIFYNIYYYLKIIGLDLLYLINILKIECINCIPLLYSICNLSYGFYLLYSSIIFDVIHNIFMKLDSTNTTLYTNSSLNMCYI